MDGWNYGHLRPKVHVSAVQVSADKVNTKLIDLLHHQETPCLICDYFRGKCPNISVKSRYKNTFLIFAKNLRPTHFCQKVQKYFLNFDRKFRTHLFLSKSTKILFGFDPQNHPPTHHICRVLFEWPPPAKTHIFLPRSVNGDLRGWSNYPIFSFL